MNVQRLVQSTVVVEHEGYRLLIDPGKYNVTEGWTAERIGRVDAVVITHKHADHFDLELTDAFVAMCDPKIYTNPEIAIQLRNESIGCQVVTSGDRCDIGPYHCVMTKTDHVVRDEAIVNFGIVIAAADRTVFHTSDTRLIESKVFGCDEAIGADLMFVPISNRGVVMSIDDALYFAADFRPKSVVPTHYDSPKDRDRIRPEHFMERARQLRPALPALEGIAFRVMAHGDVLEI